MQNRPIVIGSPAHAGIDRPLGYTYRVCTWFPRTRGDRPAPRPGHRPPQQSRDPETPDRARREVQHAQGLDTDHARQWIIDKYDATADALRTYQQVEKRRQLQAQQREGRSQDGRGLSL